MALLRLKGFRLEPNCGMLNSTNCAPFRSSAVQKEKSIKFFLLTFPGRNDSQGQRSNFQQNRQGFGSQQNNSYQQRQGQQQGRQDNQSRFNNAAPPASYQRNDRPQYQPRAPYQGGSSSGPPPYQGNRPQQGNSSSGGYQQWKAQRGGFGGQQNRGGYQRFNSNNDQQQRGFGGRPDKLPGTPDSRYGGSYSRQ